MEESKPVKYVRARKQGLSQKKAMAVAGYKPSNNTVAIERSKAVVEASRTFKEAILAITSREELMTKLHANAMQQDDLGASNSAIKLLADRVEPADKPEFKAETINILIKNA